MRHRRLQIIVTVFLLSSPTIVSGQESGAIIVANMSENSVSLIDAATRETVATLPSGPSPHEIAVSESGEWAIITNYGNADRVGNSLTLIRVPDAKIEAIFDLSVYERPHGVIFLPGNSVVAITSEATQRVVFYDIIEGEVVDTVSTAQRASHMLAADLTRSTLFTTNIVDGTISEIDGVTRKRKRIIPVAAFIEGIAVSPNGDRIWVGSNRERKVLVVDASTGEIEHTFEGFGFPYRMAVSPDGRLAVLSDPMKSEIRIVDAQTLEELKTILLSSDGASAEAEFPGSASPEGLVITPDSRYAYISLQALSKVAILDLESLEIIGTARTGGWPDGIGYSPLAAVAK